LSFSSFGNQNGYFSFNPSATGASAYLLFGSCYDGRGHNSIAVDLYVAQATTLTVDVGVASSCTGKTGSAYSSPISIAATGGWQTIEIPMHFFSNQDLGKMYTIGFTGSVGKEIRVRSIKLTRKAFISRSRHELFEWEGGNRKVYRFSSFNAADLIGRSDAGQEGFLDPYEQEDQIITAKQLGGRAVRTYTLRIKSPGENAPSKAVQGLRSYGSQFVHLDRALQYANKHNIRLIIPFIDNWNYFGGIDAFNAFRGYSNNHDAFFNDATLRSDFKNLMYDVLWRVNSLTGVRYRDDPAILAWQLGNELCSSTNRNDPPASWTQEMVDYLRSQDPNHLTMDGSWSNSANGGGDWPAGLKSIANLDILSAHYYGGETSTDANLYVNRMYNNQYNANTAGKVFILDEYGIASPAILAAVQNAMKTTGWTMGALLWAIRSQSVKGGALVHYEYANYMSYQWPGYTNGPKCGMSSTMDGNKNLFSPDNYNVLNNLFQSAYAIAGAQNEAPPCTHRGAILQLAYNANSNVPSINADAGCIQTLSHTGFSASYRTVDLRIRQPTGAFSNIIQYSFDGSKFKTLGWVDMTVKEGKFLASHRIPITSTGTTRTVSYRVIGSIRNNKYLSPTGVMSVSVAGVDPAFYNAWVSATADEFSYTNCY